MAEGARKLFPVKQLTDAVGVVDVTTPAELTNNVIEMVIDRAYEAHLFHGSLSSVQQLFEPDNRKIDESWVWNGGQGVGFIRKCGSAGTVPVPAYPAASFRVRRSILPGVRRWCSVVGGHETVVGIMADYGGALSSDDVGQFSSCKLA
ncbi:unnamed protein product [Lactuca saligna]|uniref:Uncharacterized protein n=1 Tax=Lactuca saligna TaxID=75948 RepID=A0AA35ZR42_LACSI|nr:unnamed protein product [Lactuca saligna]